MDSDKTQILMVVEGQKTDVALMNHLLSVYGINQNHENRCRSHIADGNRLYTLAVFLDRVFVGTKKQSKSGKTFY